MAEYSHCSVLAFVLRLLRLAIRASKCRCPLGNRLYYLTHNLSALESAKGALVFRSNRFRSGYALNGTATYNGVNKMKRPLWNEIKDEACPEDRDDIIKEVATKKHGNGESVDEVKDFWITLRVSTPFNDRILKILKRINESNKEVGLNQVSRSTWCIWAIEKELDRFEEYGKAIKAKATKKKAR